MVDWTSADIREIIYDYLEGNLSVRVETGHWTDPNSREIVVYLGSEKVASATFDVVQKREYEG